MKTEGQEREKKGKKREKERERLREREIEKIRWWFVTNVLISECLIFLKLVFKAFWSRFHSDKHLLNFCFKITAFQLMGIDRSCIVELISLQLLRSCVGASHFFSSSKQPFIKSMFWSMIKSFSFRIFNLYLSFKTGALFGKDFTILMAFSSNFSIFLNSVTRHCPHTWHP